MTASRTQLGGLLGEALDANRRGRLSHFIVDETSPAIALFGPALRAANQEGDWYGEHAGKWLIAASRAAVRSGDAGLRSHVLRVADWLASVQEDDGYLGTYAPSRRFTQVQAPRPYSWDGAPAARTWDVWTHAYLVLGLLATWRSFGERRHLDAATRIGDLCIAVFEEQGKDITALGNHFGLSATVLLDPVVELHFATGEARFLALAERIHAQAEAHPESAIVARALSGADPSEIATGKAYQLLWNLVGIAKLHRATGRAELLAAALALWEGVRERHLTPGGGPWGGVAHRSREVFNAAGAFDPRAYVETCSILAWIQLNQQLLAITREPRFADEIERSAYNDLLGAQAPDGEDWCYYSFPNGRRVHTTYWRCCKSSGAMALEELPAAAWSLAADGVVDVDLLGPSEFEFEHPDAGRVRLVQDTAYPYDGRIRIRVHASRPARFTLSVRVPAWATEARIVAPGGVAREPTHVEWSQRRILVDREWREGDTWGMELAMAPRLRRASLRNVQESRAPDGTAVAQQVLGFDYVCLERGPLSYATGLVDGFKTDETLRLPNAPLGEWLSELPGAGPGEPPRLLLQPLQRQALEFVPAFLADGRRAGGWRLTWLSLAPAIDADGGAQRTIGSD
jgi:DUF1680 family protein